MAARAAIRPQVALDALAVELRDTGQRWQMLTGDDPTTDVRSVFSWSYEALTPGAARLFRLLGLHPGPDITAPAAASLAGLPTGTVRPLLAELTGASLLVEHIAGRYAFHDLLRAYATDLTHATDPEQERHAATHRMLDHCLHSAYAAERLMNPTRDPLDLAPTQPGVTPEQPADHQQATSWFTAEHAVLLAAVDRAATGFDTHTWQLAWSLWTYQFGHGRLHDWIPAGRAAAAAAARQGDRPAQGLALRKLAQVYMQLRRLDDADSDLRLALDLYRQAGDLAGQAHTENSLSQLCDERDRPGEALDHARRALELYRAAGHAQGQGQALNSIGWYHARLGESQQALDACQQALKIFEELDDLYGQAATSDSLGYAHQQLGDHARAIACYQKAVDLSRDTGQLQYVSMGLVHLGDAYRDSGDADAARTAWREAFTILDGMDHPSAEQVQSKLADLDSHAAPDG